MKKEGYYSSGEFAQMAHVTKKTLRYYDACHYLKPSLVTESGARFYTDQDFQKLQQIRLLKYLGFSLEDIREMTMQDASEESFLHSLKLQMELLDERMEQMKVVREILQDTTDAVQQKAEIDWSHLMESISVTSLENSLKQQYKNASNISARIRLHRLYAVNPTGWFPWVYEQCGIRDGETVLELGCGSGSLWLENRKKIPEKVHLILTDRSEGMIRELKKAMAEGQAEADLGRTDERMEYRIVDFHRIPYADDSADIVIANHVLFYAQDMEQVLSEIRRVLKPDGRLVCGTYGQKHMMEISHLAAEFDDRIVLAGKSLYEIFGKENGSRILQPFFENVEWREYEDRLLVTEPEALVDYVLSCHGNQNQYIVDRYKEFRQFVKQKVRKGFSVTKEAGVFVAYGIPKAR